MKKVLILGLLFLGFLVGGASLEEGRTLKTDAFGWDTIGEQTTAVTVSTYVVHYTDAVSAYSDSVYTTFDPYRINTLGLRFVMNDDHLNDAVFQVFMGKGVEDYLVRIATLTIQAGTAISGHSISAPDTTTDTVSTHFCDTITVSNENWITALTAVDNGGNNRIATVWWDLHGYSTIMLVGTTLDSTTLVQATGF